MNREQKKKRRSAREVRTELRAIYADASGKLPDLTKLSHSETSKTTRFLVKAIVILLGLSLVAWTGFFLFTQGIFDSNQTLLVEIDGPEEIKSGEMVSYKIRYENTGDVPIASLEMKLNMPSSFHLLSTIPEADAPDQWTIGSLTPKSDGAITINGIFLSEVPSSQRIQTLFTYKPANFNSEFQDIQTATVKIEESVVQLSLEGPEKALAGDEIEYTLNIQHTGEETIFNLRLLPLLPEDFSITSSKPEIEKENGYWSIDQLKPAELKAITFKGSFTSSASGEQHMIARLGFVKEDTFLKQAEELLTTDVLGGAVSFHLIIDGSDKNQNIAPGKTLRGSIDFKNKGAETAEDISFSLTLETQRGSLPIDWENALLSDGVRSGARITWDFNVLDSLEKLEPGSSGVIDFSLPIKSNISSSDADSFTVSLAVEIARVGSITSTRKIEATPIVISLNSNARARAEVRYFTVDGQPVGAGPLPPEVGQTTSYRVFFNIDNSLHDLEGVKVSTILPQDVTYKDKTATDIGDISYNPTTRQVLWIVNKLPTEISAAGAWFDIAITPSNQDAGSFFKLTNQVSFEATDSVTADELNKGLEILTSDLSSDEFGKGKGVVVE